MTGETAVEQLAGKQRLASMLEHDRHFIQFVWRIDHKEEWTRPVARDTYGAYHI